MKTLLTYDYYRSSLSHYTYCTITGRLHRKARQSHSEEEEDGRVRRFLQKSNLTRTIGEL